MTILKIAALAFSLLSFYAHAHKDHAHAANSPMNTMAKPQGLGSASMTLLERDIKLFDGYGKGMFYMNPTNDEQRYVNQGYAALNVFHYADAYRSFRMAILENSNSVQGHVGLIFSIMDQDGSAEAQRMIVEFLNHIEMIKTAEGLTVKEDAWVEYAKSLFVYKNSGQLNGYNGSSAKNLNNAYQDLAMTDGMNIEFLSYVSWTIFSGGTVNYVKQTLQDVLSIHSDHPGATHYLLHIAEMENDMVTARNYGYALAPLAPKSAHAIHMLGHTLPQFGMWQEALDAFLVADQIHNDWATENQAELQEDWHYAHNLDLMAAAYLGLGNDRKAYETWAMSMPYDFRAIPKAIGVLLATNRLVEADQLITQLEQNGPQWVNFLSGFRYELNVLQDQNTPQIKSLPQAGSYDALVAQLRNMGNNKSFESNLISNATMYFRSKLTSGGFDGWSNSFVELLRLKNLADVYGATTVSFELEQLIEASRNGTL